VPLEETGETYPYDFGVLELHERRSVTFRFRASGQHQLRVLDHDAEGDFKLDDVPASALLGTLAVPHNLELETVKATAMPGDDIQVTATFIAQRAGACTGKLRIYTNAGNLRTIVIPIRARVESFSLVLVQPSLPPTLDLGGVDIGDTKTATLTVRNDGTRGAWLETASFSDPTVGGQVAVQTGAIGAGQTRAYALSYQPAFVGPLETDAALHFTDGQLPPQHQHDVVFKLVAVGVGAQVRFRPRALHFPPTAVGATSPPHGHAVAGHDRRRSDRHGRDRLSAARAGPARIGIHDLVGQPVPAHARVAGGRRNRSAGAPRHP
jgi:hypothetical protein